MIPHHYFSKICTQFFYGDTAKTWRWFKEINASLGDTPYNMVLKRKDNKLLKYIDEAIKRGYL